MERKTTDDASSKKEEIERRKSKRKENRKKNEKEDVNRMHSRLIRSFTQGHIQTYQIQSRRTSANHTLKTLLHIYKTARTRISCLHQEGTDTRQRCA